MMGLTSNLLIIGTSRIRSLLGAPGIQQQSLAAPKDDSTACMLNGCLQNNDALQFIMLVVLP